MRRLPKEQPHSLSVYQHMLHPDFDSRRHFRIFMATFAAVAIAVIGCADFGTGMKPVDDGGNNGGDTATVSFATNVLPIFQTNCSGAFCHSPCGPNNAHEFCLASHSSILGHESVVTPGDAQNSLLVKHIEGRETPRMPYGRLPLSDSLIQVIRTWIDEGAQNN